MQQVKDTQRATVRLGFDGRVHKTFRGPDAEKRFANEVRVLQHLEKRGCPFVPRLLEADPAPIVEVDAPTGFGMDDLRAALDDLLVATTRLADKLGLTTFEYVETVGEQQVVIGVDSGTTMVVIGRFLALLELYREGVIAFEQLTPLGDLTVRWTGGEADDEEQADDDTDRCPGCHLGAGRPAGRRAPASRDCDRQTG